MWCSAECDVSMEITNRKREPALNTETLSLPKHNLKRNDIRASVMFNQDLICFLWFCLLVLVFEITACNLRRSQFSRLHKHV